MADSNIGSLTAATSFDDDSLLVTEQQGTAKQVSGSLVKSFVKTIVDGYAVDASEAAERAVAAASEIENMTVEAATLATGQSATVTKSIKNSVVNLKFGLPRGEQGEAGPQGPQGATGPRGATGSGLKVLGHYDTEDELRAAQTAPEVGDAYGVGTETPYNIYIFDGVTNDWVDYGALSGTGGVLSDDLVTCEGGATIEIEGGWDDGPHIIRITNEEEPALTAEDISYGDSQTVQGAMDELFTSVSDGKALIASAITDKGVTTAQDAAFSTMAENIGQISTGSDASDATATAYDILSPKTAYTAAGKVEGVIPTLAAQTITPGTANQTIANGQYLGGTQTIKGDTNLVSGNIKSGVSIFGVKGALETTFKATLTVKADTGAVVTATHTDGTEVSGLSSNGSVTLDLPISGTWSVTAVRGVAQYNTVTIVVSSEYSAELTAEVHIEYFGSVTALSAARYFLTAASVGNYALFGGGYTGVSTVDAYDTALVHSNPDALSHGRNELAATTVGNYALFGGGNTGSYAYTDAVDAYNTSLTRSTPTVLSAARYRLAATTIGNYALFGGGEFLKSSSSSSKFANVDVYDSALTRTAATDLIMATYYLAAGSNGNYALFGGGSDSSYVNAYDKNLTRTIPTSLTSSRKKLSAARAGNYVLFAGGPNNKTVDAYDLFLTRTSPEELSYPRAPQGATLHDFAIFGGGETGDGTGYSGVTDVYDPYLVMTVPGTMSSRRQHAAATVGDYALFGGGYSTEKLSVVSAYHYV